MQKVQRVLYVHGGILRYGGTESYMMNYYRYFEHQKIQVDFVVHGFEKGVYDDEVKSLGGNIYNIPLKSKEYLKNISALKRIFNTNKYKIIHSHMDAGNTHVLKIAKECGIPIRIAHSHNTGFQIQNKIKLIYNIQQQKKIKKYATNLMACSDLAGKWLYEDGNYQVISNAIDVDKFIFNSKIRQEERKKLNIQLDSFVVGVVGRFAEQKNPQFILKIFSEVLKRNKNALLIWIGDGDLKKEIEDKSKALGIYNSILFLGNRADTNKLYQTMDVFLLPSKFEGLPIVGIEAQANGLPLIVSDRITSELDISGLVTFLSLEKSAAYWAKAIIDRSDIKPRINTQKRIENAGYSIKKEALKLQDFYLNLLNKSN